MKIWVNHSHFSFSILGASLLLLFFTEGFASTHPQFTADEESIYYEELIDEPSINDPLEMINRPIFHFNDFCYTFILDPINGFYTKVTTQQVRSSIVNFFDNLKFPVRLLGNVLKFELKDASYECIKFSLNSTYGLLGLNKPSEKIAFLAELEEEDLGTVLAYWGVPEGPYLVVPFLGPSTIRDFPTKLLEPILNPFEDVDNLSGDASNEWVVSFYTIEFMAMSSEIMSKYKLLKQASLDPYVSLRSSYYQFKYND